MRIGVIALCPLLATGCMRARVAIPPRPVDAMAGSEFIREVRGLSLDDREARILAEITRGNLPDFLRVCVPIRISTGAHRGRYYCLPDYLGIGSDADYVRIPMTPATAQAIADRFGCVLPTRKMVDDIYAQAAIKLAPSPFSPTQYDITSVDIFWQAQLRIEMQRAGQPLGRLIAGLKKDVVITPQLATKPGKVAIYGWHQLDGQPIQPLYLGHTARWVDYSHGIRLIAEIMDVDGTQMRIPDVARNPALSPLISDEGPFDWPRY